MTEDNIEQTESTEEIENRYSDDSEYTVDLNGRRYALNGDARDAIETRAEHEYSENPMFDCFWKVAHPEQYEKGSWSETIHDKGDPVLVITTRGPFVPWERMDSLNVEMQNAEANSQFDGAGSGETNDIDNGNGTKLIPPGDDDEDVEKQIGRTHFGLTPQQFEEIPSPDGEDGDKIPPKPEKMGEEPVMVKWLPERPEIEHSWSAGEAIAPMFNRVEWNVQKRADQPRLREDKPDSHDHWESLLGFYDCEQVAELSTSQDVPSGVSDSNTNETTEDLGPKRTDGTANWRV